MSALKLNLGCGFDKREGYLNVDGNELFNPDVIIRIPEESLFDHFAENSVDEILMQDFLEHFFKWEAEKILREAVALLKPEGTIAIRVPDFNRLVLRSLLPGWLPGWRNRPRATEWRITLFFGGHDIPQGEEDPQPRRCHPEFYCHKYAYTQKSMRQLLERVGFAKFRTWAEGRNFWTIAAKK